MADTRQVDDAVAAARKGQKAWAAMRPAKRRDILFRYHLLVDQQFDELALIRTLENGQTIGDADKHRHFIREWMAYYAGWADKIEGRVVATMPAEHFQYEVAEPNGVVAAIIPWNSPPLSLAMKLPPALAAGNAVVIKPPETTPFSSIWFAEKALEAGVPAGLVNVVIGGPETGEALVTHRGIDKISFTGGVKTAQRIMAASAARLTPGLYELGGKSANLIFDDADMEKAAPLAALFPMANTGQGCALPTRLLVQDSCYEQVLEKIKACCENVPVIGDPLDPATTFGPLYHQVQLDRVLGFIERAKATHAGRLLTGGERLGGGLSCGYFVAPTVFADVDPQSEIWQQEIFGPVLCIRKFKTEEEAIELANGTEWGLAAYVQTSNLQRAHRLAAALRAGVVHMNGAPNVHYASTFGGVGLSGFGREGGKAGLDEMLRIKGISTC